MYQQRPTSVTVFGVLNVVFAILGLLLGVRSMVTDPAASVKDAPPEVQSVIENIHPPAAWTYVSGGLGMAASVALGVAGIGMLRMRNWGRVLSLAWAYYSIVTGVIGVLVVIASMALPMFTAAGNAQGQNATMLHTVAVAVMAGIIAGGVCGLTYPVLLICFMQRAKMREAFARAAAPVDADPYAPPQPPLPPGIAPYQSPPRDEQGGGWKSDR